MTDREFVRWAKDNPVWSSPAQWDRLNSLALPIKPVFGPKMNRDQLCDLATLRIDLAESSRKLDRVREEVDGCFMNGPSPIGPLHGVGWNEAVSYVKSRVLAILDDSAVSRPVPETRIIIDNPDLIPDELCTVTVTMNVSSWAILARDEVYGPALSKLSIARVASLSLIAQRLNEKCQRCEGNGGLCGPTGVAWDQCDCGMCERGPGRRIDCPECGGTGHKSVPGARFAAPAQHVECK